MGTIRLKFIGKDGSMGLRQGRTYVVNIYTDRKHVFVDWHYKYDGECSRCAYSSIKKMLENWEEV